MRKRRHVCTQDNQAAHHVSDDHDRHHLISNRSDSLDAAKCDQCDDDDNGDTGAHGRKADGSRILNGRDHLCRCRRNVLKHHDQGKDECQGSAQFLVFDALLHIVHRAADPFADLVFFLCI